MRVLLIDDQGKTITPPCIIRLPGWTEERYFREAPEGGKCEFVRGDLIIMTPMGRDHSEVVNFLSFLLTGHSNFFSVFSGQIFRRDRGLCFSSV